MTMQPPAPDLPAIKVRQQQTWAAGDYARVGNTLVLVAELLCEAVDLRAGQRVLDVATGSGNAALAAARRFADVTGVDYVPALLEQARERAAAERLSVEFKGGDAEHLPFPDRSFDIALSTFGAMFAPDQEKVASELLRVIRPGGKIGMANWTPDGYVGQLFRATGRHVPPPTGLNPPVLWGTEERLRELLGDQIASLETTRRAFVFRYPSASHYREFMQRVYGPTVKAFEALDPAGQDALAHDIEALVQECNRSGDDTVVVPADYLEVVATKR